jgi:hypothetical protein
MLLSSRSSRLGGETIGHRNRDTTREGTKHAQAFFRTALFAGFAAWR